MQVVSVAGMFAVLGAVVMALTAAIFSFNLGVLSCHFFFWAHLPCPGPGMLDMVGAG